MAFRCWQAVSGDIAMGDGIRCGFQNRWVNETFGVSTSDRQFMRSRTALHGLSSPRFHFVR